MCGDPGGGVSSPTVMEAADQMYNACLRPALLTAVVAHKLLRRNGLLVLTGSSAALNPMPNALGYSFAKSSTHLLVTSMAQSDSRFTTVGVLPQLIDTPGNRFVHNSVYCACDSPVLCYLPSGATLRPRTWVKPEDAKTMTSPREIAEKILSWTREGLDEIIVRMRLCQLEKLLCLFLLQKSVLPLALSCELSPTTTAEQSITLARRHKHRSSESDTRKKEVLVVSFFKNRYPMSFHQTMHSPDQF
jgi:short-subunit dehydrogenase